MRTLAIGFALGKVTFREVIRDKILYNILLCGILLFGVAVLASRLMIHHEDRVVLDFGLSAINLSGSMLATLVGGSILSREIERRTILVCLARPISRHQFVFGKLLGLWAVILANWALLSCVLGFVLYGATTDPASVFGSTLALSLLLQLFQALLIGSVALAISAASTTSLAVIISIGLYLIGNNIQVLREIADKSKDSWVAPLLKSVSYALPGYEHFVLGTQVTYGLPVSWGIVLGVMAYALVWMAIAWAAAGVFLSAREL